MTIKPTAFAVFTLVLAGGAILAESVLAAPPTPITSNPVLIYINRGFGIEVSNADGTAKTELIAKSSLTRPSWAPAATETGYPHHVVYESPICRLKQFDMNLINGKPVAENISVLPTPFADSACAAEISPIGDRLVFGEGHVEPGQISSIWTMPVAGGDGYKVVDGLDGAVITWASFNQDATLIAYIEQGPGSIESIKIINSDGTNPTLRLSTGGRFIEWSPNGTKLAYSGNCGGSTIEGICLMEASGVSPPTRLTSGTMPTWMGNDKLVYTASTGISVLTIGPPLSIQSLVRGAHHPKYRN